MGVKEVELIELWTLPLIRDDLARLHGSHQLHVKGNHYSVLLCREWLSIIIISLHVHCFESPTPPLPGILDVLRSLLLPKT